MAGNGARGGQAIAGRWSARESGAPVCVSSSEGRTVHSAKVVLRPSVSWTSRKSLSGGSWATAGSVAARRKPEIVPKKRTILALDDHELPLAQLLDRLPARADGRSRPFRNRRR